MTDDEREARARCREAAQILIERFGASGPMSVVEAARRAVEKHDEKIAAARSDERSKIAERLREAEAAEQSAADRAFDEHGQRDMCVDRHSYAARLVRSLASSLTSPEEPAPPHCGVCPHYSTSDGLAGHCHRARRKVETDDPERPEWCPLSSRSPEETGQ